MSRLDLVAWDIDHPELLIGVVVADGVSIGPSDADLDELVAETVAAAGAGGLEALRGAVRDMLRRGGFKPTGRNKPASEYLVAAAGRGDFPRINCAVDVNNVMSLATGWPMSVLDLDLALAGGDGPSGALSVRLGRLGERYVFNTAGQEIELEGLVLIAGRGGEALANPVKDAMTAKTHAATQRLIAFIYASARVTTAEALATDAARYADLLGRYTRAARVESWVLRG